MGSLANSFSNTVIGEETASEILKQDESSTTRDLESPTKGKPGPTSYPLSPSTPPPVPAAGGQWVFVPQNNAASDSTGIPTPSMDPAMATQPQVPVRYYPAYDAYGRVVLMPMMHPPQPHQEQPSQVQPAGAPPAMMRFPSERSFMSAPVMMSPLPYSMPLVQPQTAAPPLSPHTQSERGSTPSTSSPRKGGGYSPNNRKKLPFRIFKRESNATSATVPSSTQNSGMMLNGEEDSSAEASSLSMSSGPVAIAATTDSSSKSKSKRKKRWMPRLFSKKELV